LKPVAGPNVLEQLTNTTSIIRRLHFGLAYGGQQLDPALLSAEQEKKDINMTSPPSF
jgi:hypothetical protein